MGIFCPYKIGLMNPVVLLSILLKLLIKSSNAFLSSLYYLSFFRSTSMIFFAKALQCLENSRSFSKVRMILTVTSDTVLLLSIVANI